MYRFRRQKRLPAGQHREALPSCVIEEIKDAVEEDALRYGVSKSFVIAVILANAYGINKQEDFLDTPLTPEKKVNAERLKIKKKK